MLFIGVQEGHTSQHTAALIGLRRPNIGREFFWLSALNFKDIPHHGDSRETLDRVHVKHILSNGAFISRLKPLPALPKKWA